MENTGEILLRASKAYWKTKNSVDFVFTEHKQWETIEVIAYEPVLGVEAPRIYLSEKVVRSRVDSSAIDGYLRSAKFAAIRKGEAPNVPMLIKSAERTAKASYVLNRLFLRNYSPDKVEFSVDMQFDFNDRDNDQGGLDVDTMVIDKPCDLVPYFIDWSVPRGFSSKSGSFRGGSMKGAGPQRRPSEKFLTINVNSGGSSSDGDLTPTKPGLQKRNSSPLPPRAGLLSAFRTNAPTIDTDGSLSGKSGKSDSSDSSSDPSTPTHIALPRRATSPNIPFRPEGFSGGRSGRRSWRDTHSEGGSAKPPFALPVHEEEPEREEAELAIEAETQTGMTDASFSGKRAFLCDPDALTTMMSPCTSGKATIQSSSGKGGYMGSLPPMMRSGDSKSMLGRLFSSFTSAYGSSSEDSPASPSGGLTARLSRLILRRSGRVQDCDDEDRDSLAPLKGPGPGLLSLSHKTAPMDMSQESARTGMDAVSRSSSSGLDVTPSPASSWKSWGVVGQGQGATVLPVS